jgi:hypothetical protein
MIAKPLPSAARLRALFRYDRRTGALVWRKRSDVPPCWNTRFAGQEAGHRSALGIAVTLNYKILRTHRVIWKMVHDQEPDEVDHKDGDPLNNRLANLRAATRMQNMGNTRLRPGASGLRGVARCRRRWSATICVAGRSIRLGTYDTPAEAHAAYRRAARRYFGAFARLD